MIDIHIGLDLSFNSTGITFYNEIYNENNEKIKSNIEFHRLVRDKEITTISLNLNQHIYYSQLLSVDLNLKHKQDDSMIQNGLIYSSDQIDLTEKFYISVAHIMKIIVEYFKKTKTNNKINNNKINVYLNFEGSILSGHNFNTQIGVNMLQGHLRGELIKFQLANHFNIYKIRMVPPTLLKSFFTKNGDADKKLMIETFINLYDGRKLLPQIDTSNKQTEIFNDVIDSFALVAFNVYDMKMDITEKNLFKTIVPKKPKIRKQRKSKKIVKVSDIVSTELLNELNSNTIESDLLRENGMLN